MTLKARRAPAKRTNKESVLLVAQEIKFARALAGNDKKHRDRVLKTLRRWFTQRCSKNYEFKEEDFLRIWKGLFYAVWMSDKPLVQEELCESISEILDLFPEGHGQQAVLFFKCSLQTLATEWYGIDQHRIDKFLMLVRRLLRATFRSMRRDGWAIDVCRSFATALSDVGSGLLAPEPPVFARNALGLQLHLVDCYAEELAKVCDGEIPDASITELMRPMAQCMALGREPRLSGSIKKNVFVHLLRQSELGQEYEERKSAWTRMGCPTGGVDGVEKVPISDDEDNDEPSDNEDFSEERPLDPRAGHVDVILPSLPVPAGLMVEMLKPLAAHKQATTANRHRVRTCIKHLEDMAEGRYPLRAKDDLLTPTAPELKMPRPGRAARKLHEFQKRLERQSDELALRGLSRKHRKRILSKIRENPTTTEDDSTAGQDGGDRTTGTDGPAERKRPKLQRQSNRGAGAGKSGGWQIEETTPDSKKNNEKENSDRPKKDKLKKRKVTTTLQDEVPLKKLKNLLKPKENCSESKENENTKKSMRNIEVKEKSSTDLVKSSMRKGKIDSELKKKPKDMKKLAKPNILAKKIGSPTKISSPEKLKKFQKQAKEQPKKETKLRGKKVDKESETSEEKKLKSSTPKKVTIVLKNNTSQGAIDYYKSVKQSPSIPFDSAKKPTKTNLKPNAAPSPINPFFKKKLKQWSMKKVIG